MVAVAIVWRLAFWAAVRGTPLATWHEWAESDMATFVAQAERIADGDWLLRRPYYPYHAWMQRVPEQEMALWRPRGALYQPPATATPSPS